MAKRNDLLDIPMTIEWLAKPNRKYFLKHLIEKYNVKTMAEIGVRDGRTTFFLLDSLPHLKIYGVDLSSSGYYSHLIKKKYEKRLVPIEGNSHKVAHLIPVVDLVFIDADHSYNGCKGDIIAYKSKLNSGGILAGHDIDYPGVNRAVNELVKNYEVGPNNVWFTLVS